MANIIIQDLTAFFNTINTPVGVAVLLVIGYVILPRLKFLKDFLPKTQETAIDDLKPILLGLAQGIEKIQGNDLTHLKDDIMTMGQDVRDFRSDFLKHDKQAGEILTRVNDVWSKVNR